MTKVILVRDDGTIAAGGLKLIEAYASQHKTQRTIAAALGLTLKQFEKLMEKNKGDNDVRRAWEAGFALFEQDITDKMRGMAFGDVVETEYLDEDGNPVIDEETGAPKKVKIRAPISKASTIAALFFCKTQLGWSEKPTGALVQDNRIQITLPAPMAFGEMLHALGQKEIADFRKDRKEPLKDVTPDYAKVPALPKPEGE